MNGVALTLEGFLPSAFMNYSSWASCQRGKGRFEELNAGEGSFVSVKGSYCQGSSCLFYLRLLKRSPHNQPMKHFLADFVSAFGRAKYAKNLKFFLAKVTNPIKLRLICGVAAVSSRSRPTGIAAHKFSTRQSAFSQSTEVWPGAI
jgi:hypothetical protein